MPTITLQVGQCGNQLGNTLLLLLQEQQHQLCNALLGREWFREQHSSGGGDALAVPRAISIDSESKVARSWGGGSAPHQLHILGHGGCGNNWACGYHFGVSPSGSSQQRAAWSSSDETPSRVEQVMEGVRKEAEGVAGVVDFLMIASLAGGTGSGTGSALLEALADEYPASTLAAVAVAPGQAGDSTLQSINSCLAMQQLSTYVHAVMLIDNQALLNQLNSQISNCGSASAIRSASASCAAAATGGKASRGAAALISRRQNRPAGAGSRAVGGRACLDDVNWLAAQGLLGLLWPVSEEDLLCGRSNIRQLASTICADPVTKFVEVCHVSQPTSAWGNMGSSCGIWPPRIQLLSSQLPKFHPHAPTQPASTSAVLIITRGMPGTPAVPPAAAGSPGSSCWTSQSCWGLGTVCPGSVNSNLLSSAWQQDLASAVCSSWPYFSGNMMDVHLGCSSVKVWSADAAVQGGQPSMTAAVRRSSIGSMMCAAAERAMQLCTAGAYMHWYERYGCSRQKIMDAAQQVAELAECYSSPHAG